ncbi:MAG: hypothetical protein BroJett040_25160 [Oligoflexia bacterium]|nr:MAG: hypothetical protein BroJett040_25160 [Oligoflexia bacterium]
MTAKHEALRLFLAITALILVAMLTNKPLSESMDEKITRKIASPSYKNKNRKMVLLTQTSSRIKKVGY